MPRCSGERTRRAAIFHPGGIQWWLRELAGEREDFAAFVCTRHAGANGDGGDVTAFVMFDGNYVIAESDGDGPPRTELIEWATQRLRARGATEIETPAVEAGALDEFLRSAGFEQFGAGFELIADTTSEVAPRPLPEGFRFASLLDVDDDRFIDGHRAAWSDTRPSPYRRALHDAVIDQPQFRRDLVTIVLAPTAPSPLTASAGSILCRARSRSSRSARTATTGVLVWRAPSCMK